MKPILLLSSLLAAGTLSAAAETVNFDAFPVGSPPPGWITGQSARGTAVWKVETDPSAPSAPNVLRQSGSAGYAWCVKSGTSIHDGAVEVKFKPLAGKRAQAGGVVFRYKGPDRYYVARANANESNLNLYWFDVTGRHEAIVVDTPVALNRWHTLRAEFQGKSIKVALDGKTLIDLEDGHVGGAGAVGVWTRFDSDTLFDDFTYQ
jgi:hypothetical protein